MKAIQVLRLKNPETVFVEGEKTDLFDLEEAVQPSGKTCIPIELDLDQMEIE